MERICLFAFGEYDSPPFYSQVNVYEFVNKHARLGAVTFAICASKNSATEFHLSAAGATVITNYPEWVILLE